MSTSLLLWLIVALPLAACLVIGLGIRHSKRLSGYLSILAVAVSAVLSLSALNTVLTAGTHEVSHRESFPLFSVAGASFELGVLLDPLTAMMLLAVTVVSLLVQIYSQGYMAGDSGYGRYFAFMSLFTASMLGLVIANNFFQLFVFWELVGLCSYLLIGFWYHKPEAAAAAKKAFLITRIGDFGFLIAILILFNQTGTFDFHEIEQAAKAGVLAVGLLTLVMVLVFSGAVGKSAQFPLHVWLPDAMEGPTPVSALIHAATMVAAGVYLVARLFELFKAAPDAMLVVASIGAFTALFAASHALVARDIKRVLAYSTVSQLGYMMLGLGVGAFSAGTLHLLNHAAFKALLFLAAGSVIHSTGEQDLFRLGRLAGKMKVTAITFLIGGLALAGVPPLSGFWSKDEILTATLQSGHWLLFLVAMLTTALTAFYISRAWLLTFWGDERGTDADRSNSHVHESPAVMTVPLIVLAVPSVLAGFLGSPLAGNAFGQFIHGDAHLDINVGVMAGSTILALIGIGLAWRLYGRTSTAAAELTARFDPLHKLLTRKYYVDDLYDWIVSRPFLGASHLLARFDRVFIDGAVNGLATQSYALGIRLTRTQTGLLPNYGLAIFAGVVAIAAIVLASGL